MTALPAHVGRETDAETGYALVCNATCTDPFSDPICGQPAQWHLRWEAETTENGLACEGHLAFALRFRPFQVHSVTNSACGMPGSYWIVDDPSHCSMSVMTDGEQRARAEPRVGADT